MTLQIKLGITGSPELAQEEERISKKKAIDMFDAGFLDTLEAGSLRCFWTFITNCLPISTISQAKFVM